MADTINIPKLGEVKKNWLVAGGALIAGIVGYAWWRKGAAAPDAGTVEGTVPSESVTDEGTVGAGVSGNVQYAGADTSSQDFTVPTTNAEWGSVALERVTTLSGFDPTLAATAIGKFLARQPLTDAEAAVVMAARAVAGDPPQNGPWLIIHATGEGTPAPTPVPTTLGTPAGLRVTHNGPYRGSKTYGSVALDWNPLTGATKYRVTIRNTHTGYTSSRTVSSSNASWTRLRRGTTYQVTVAGITAAGRVGKAATIRFKVA